MRLNEAAHAGPAVMAALISPSLVVRLLFGAEVSGPGTVMSRVAGIALIGLGVACWPGPPRVGMLTCGAAVTLYLAYVGFVVRSRPAYYLWPAVVLHVILTARVDFEHQQATRRRDALSGEGVVVDSAPTVDPGAGGADDRMSRPLAACETGSSRRSPP